MLSYLQMFFQLYYYCSRVTYINYNKKFCMASPEAVAKRCSLKKLLLKLRTEFTGKHQCQSLFNKVASLQTWSERLQWSKKLQQNICEQLLLCLRYYTPANNTAKVVTEEEEEIQFETEFFFLESFKSRLTHCYPATITCSKLTIEALEQGVK